MIGGNFHYLLKTFTIMAEDRITEKVYCYDHPSAYNNNNDAALIAAMCNRQHTDPMAMAAMMNGGMGMNNWMNNPFAYIMFLALFRNGFGFGGDGVGFGQGQQNVEMQNQLQAIRSQLQDNQNSNLLMDAIRGNEFALSQLSQNLQVDFNTLQKCCCDVQAAIQNVAGQVGFSAERVINAVNMGDCNVIQALKDCCCQTQQLVQRMGYENQLAQKDTISAMQNGFCNLGYNMQTGFDRTNTGLERGFAQIGYDTQKQTCDIINAGTANTQRIIDTLNNHWNDENQRKIQDLKFELSQERQNNLILNRLNGCGCHSGCGCGNGCGC